MVSACVHLWDLFDEQAPAYCAAVLPRAMTARIRDLIQNHLLQVVSYLAMEAPSSMWPEAIRDEQAKRLRTVRPLSPERLVLGQFRGSRDESGVAKDSQVPTFVALELFVDSGRWHGVPFYVRAGRSRLPPQVVIGMGARAKGRAEQMVGQPVELTVVEAPWAIVDSVLHVTAPLHEYEPGSTGPPEAERLVADVGGWIPQAAVVA